jgi:hypothetical protein
VAYSAGTCENGVGRLDRDHLYSFTGGSDGSSPGRILNFDEAGNLYGTTASGGSGAMVSNFRPSQAGGGEKKCYMLSTAALTERSPTPGIGFSYLTWLPMIPLSQKWIADAERGEQGSRPTGFAGWKSGGRSWRECAPTAPTAHHRVAPAHRGVAVGGRGPSARPTSDREMDGLVRPSAIGGCGKHQTRLGTFFSATVAAAVTARTFHIETGAR